MTQLFTAWPFLGSRRMTAMLRAEGHDLNRKRAAADAQDGHRRARAAAAQHQAGAGHKIFPYLLRGLVIETRTAALSSDPSWPGLKAIGKITTSREINGKIGREVLLSPQPHIHAGKLSRNASMPSCAATWGIENGLH